MTLAEITPRDEAQLSDVLAHNKKSKDAIIVLEKNENSFLVPFAKESTQEFFELVFAKDGPFWSTYARMGLGEAPEPELYCVFLAHQMYFSKNIELTHVFTNKTQKGLIWNNGQLKMKTRWNIDTALRVLAAPFEIFSHAQQVMVSAFIANEALLTFKEAIEQSEKAYTLALKKKTWTASNAHQALQSAVEAMRYAFLFTLAHALKLKASSAAEELITQTKKTTNMIYTTKSQDPARGFWGNDPYDISKPRVAEGETLSQTEVLLPRDVWLLLREQAKYVCARYLAIERMSYSALGKKLELGDDLFYLQTTELTQSKKILSQLVANRKKAFERDSKTLLPSRLVHTTEWFFDASTAAQSVTLKKGNTSLQQTPIELEGKSVGAQVNVTAPIVWIRGREDLRKDCNGKIIVTTYFSPNLVEAFSGARGIISSVGGALSHPAIIAREKGLPCIVGVSNITTIDPKSKVILNGKTGKIEVIPR